jgi:biotin carboxylase
MLYCGIIDPYISGQFLVDGLRAQQIQPLALITDWDQAIKLQAIQRFQPEKFAKVINIANLSDNQIDEQLKAFQPLTILAGTEYACALADRIASRLSPQFANPPSSSSWRFNKAAMQTAIIKAGIPAARTESINSTNHLKLKQILQNWQWPVVIKPAETGGSFGIKICHNIQEVEQQVQFLLDRAKYPLAQESVHAVLLQEFLKGEEYFIDTCSHQESHRLACLVCYKKELRNGLPVYRYIELKDFASKKSQILCAYLKQVLTAVELRNGLAHTEIMLTQKGPRLIEVNPRISGAYGLVNALANKVYHDDQVTLLAKAIKNPTRFLLHADTIPTFHCYARLVFLHCFEKRKIRELNSSLINQLASYSGHLLLKKSGALISGEGTLAETVAMVELLHNDPEIVSSDTGLLFQYEENGELF